VRFHPEPVRSRAAAPAALALALSLAVAAPAGASCGASNCFLVSGVGDAVIEPGQTVVDLSYRYIPQDVKRGGTRHVDEVLVPAIDFETGTIIPAHHREYRTINVLGELDVTYGLTPNLTVAVAVPFYNDRYHEHDDDVDLAAVPPENGTFSNRAGTRGFGDVALNLRYAARTTARTQLSVGGGVKLPTGEYTLRDPEGAVGEPTLMPGTGSVDWQAAAMLQVLLPHGASGFVSASHRFTGENDLDYQLGDATVASAGAAWNATDRITLSGQVNARHTRRDRFLGRPVPSTGSRLVFLTPGARLATGPESSLYAHVQVPVFSDVNEVGLVPRYALQLGVTHSF
jgi:hypothetical protein